MIQNALRMAGQGLANFFASPGAREFGKTVATQAAQQTALSVGMEQLLPRTMGMQAPPIQESLIRAGIGSAMGVPVATGLRNFGVPSEIANAMSTLATTAPANYLQEQLLNRGRSQFIDPEQHQQPQAQYQDLAAAQQMQAMSELDRYNKQIELAYARNYTNPTHIYHHSTSPEPALDLARRGIAEMSKTHRYI